MNSRCYRHHASCCRGLQFRTQRGVFRSSSRRASTPRRVPRPRPPLAVAAGRRCPLVRAPAVPIPSDCNRAKPFSSSAFQTPVLPCLPPPSPLAARTADSDTLGVPTDLHIRDSAARW